MFALGVGAPSLCGVAGSASLTAGVEMFTCFILTSLGNIANGNEGREAASVDHAEAFRAPLWRGDIHQTPEGTESPPDSNKNVVCHLLTA